MTTSNDPNAPKIYLVWQPGGLTNPAPYPTIEYGRVKNGNGATDTNLQHHQLTEAELSLSLNELARKYPYYAKTC